MDYANSEQSLFFPYNAFASAISHGMPPTALIGSASAAHPNLPPSCGSPWEACRPLLSWPEEVAASILGESGGRVSGESRADG